MNFIGIETVCIKCNASFSSKSKLYKYLKASCVGAMEALLFLPTSSTSPIFIVKSKSIFQSLGSGLAFRDWTYTTVLITLIPQQLSPDLNPETTACVDTGCRITLVNKA